MMRLSIQKIYYYMLGRDIGEFDKKKKKKIAMGSRRNKHKRISTPGKMKGYSGKEPWSCFTVRFSSGKPLLKSQYYST